MLIMIPWCDISAEFYIFLFFSLSSTVFFSVNVELVLFSSKLEHSLYKGIQKNQTRNSQYKF